MNREAWHDYARRYGNLLSDQLYKDLSGWEVFLPAFISQRMLGGGPPVRPVDAPPPPAVAAIEEIPAAKSDTFSFRVTHSGNTEGHVVIVRITQATPSLSRRPYARRARLIRGHGPDSVEPLPPSGGSVRFDGARFSIEPGQRYGVAMRVIRLEDGVGSCEFFADLIRTGREPHRRTI